MSAPPTLEGLERDNAYLRRRNIQLQQDVADLSAESARLRQTLERMHGHRSPPAQSNPLSGGQG